MGKTTFIVKTLLPYYQSRNKKVLILCNRRLLRLQYFYSLVPEFSSYEELQRSISVDTYQAWAELLAKGAEVTDLLYGYDVVCFDEVHYFYSDSDFNGFGTYTLFQALMIAGISKTLIFMSATADCIEPYLKEYLPKSKCFVERKYDYLGKRIGDERCDIHIYDYTHLEDYSYLECILCPDLESIVLEMVQSSKKSILFLDDKEKAEKLRDLMCKNNGISTKDIKLLNAELMDAQENNYLVETMTLANKLPCKILFTTSVLDNGVSLNDDDIENLAIITESKISFLQMVGRIRVKNKDKKIKLYFCPQNAEYYSRREQQNKEILDLFEESNQKIKSNNWQVQALLMAWEKPDDRSTKMYRKFITIVPESCDYFERLQAEKVYARHCGTRFAANQFAIRKIGDMYKTEAEFHALARLDPMRVVYRQMYWLHKSEGELEILNSLYREKQENALISDLLKVKDYDLERLRELKKCINFQYGKLLFSDIVFKSGSFSKTKFEELLARYELSLEVREFEGKNLYTVKNKKEKVKENE